jgi:hypothetical protein
MYVVVVEQITVDVISQLAWKSEVWLRKVRVYRLLGVVGDAELFRFVGGMLSISRSHVHSGSISV